MASTPPSHATTPPPPNSTASSRFEALPPSPPLSPLPAVAKKRKSLDVVERLVGILRLRKSGRLQERGEEWRTFRLSRAQFVELEERLRKDAELWRWYEEKVRYDWEAQEGKYTLRMPSLLHERFIASVEDRIVEGINALAERLKPRKNGGEKVARELGRIYKGRSATIEMRAPRLENGSQETSVDGEEDEVVVRRSPDATFYHPEQPELPCLVVEVGYSQQGKDLPRLAESYVVDSQHAIRCVLGLDITYQARGVEKESAKSRDQKATLSVWRPDVEKDEDGEEIGICRTDVDAQPFRSTNGEPCAGTFDLELTDLLHPTLIPIFLSHEDLKISIPFADLKFLLHSAESNPTSHSQPPSTPRKFRKRKRTPGLDLSDEREEAYARLEEAEVVREMKVDGEWRARTRRKASGELEVVERRRSTRSIGSGRGGGHELKSDI